MIVADTNLFINISHGSPLRDLAFAVFEAAPSISAPAVWRYEYAQWLGRKLRLGQVDLEQVKETIDALEPYFPEPLADLPLYEAIRFSRKYMLSSYYTHFAFWAIANDVPLVTNDQKLIRAIPHVAIGYQDYLDRLQAT